MFIPGETISHKFVIPFKTSDIARVIVSYFQNEYVILEKNVDSGFFSESETSSSFSVTFSQEESLSFNDSSLYFVQLNVITPYGTRHASFPLKNGTGMQINENILGVSGSTPSDSEKLTTAYSHATNKGQALYGLMRIKTNSEGHVIDGELIGQQDIVDYGFKTANETDAELALKAPTESPIFTGTPKSVTPSSDSDAKMIATKEYVDQRADEIDAFQYKGIIANYNELPSTVKKGWTYKVSTAFDYNDVHYEQGDMFIRNTDDPGTQITKWDVIQTNIDGVVTGSVSSIDGHVALFNGTTGKIIKDGGAIHSIIIDDTVEDGATDKTWSADKIHDQLELKASISDPVFAGSISMGRSGNTGVNSVAAGNNVTASGNASHAEGFDNIASGTATHAEGLSTEASGQASHAEGCGTIATQSYQHVSGKYNVADNSPGQYAEIVGNGTSNTRSNARTVDWHGNEYLAGDIFVDCDPDSTNGYNIRAYVEQIYQMFENMGLKIENNHLVIQPTEEGGQS